MSEWVFVTIFSLDATLWNPQPASLGHWWTKLHSCGSKLEQSWDVDNPCNELTVAVKNLFWKNDLSVTQVLRKLVVYFYHIYNLVWGNSRDSCLNKKDKFDAYGKRNKCILGLGKGCDACLILWKASPQIFGKRSFAVTFMLLAQIQWYTSFTAPELRPGTSRCSKRNRKLDLCKFLGQNLFWKMAKVSRRCFGSY